MSCCKFLTQSLSPFHFRIHVWQFWKCTSLNEVVLFFETLLKIPKLQRCNDISLHYKRVINIAVYHCHFWMQLMLFVMKKRTRQQENKLHSTPPSSTVIVVVTVTVTANPECGRDNFPTTACHFKLILIIISIVIVMVIVITGKTN